MADAPIGSAPTRVKRFYTNASLVAGEGGYVLALDGRPARTPARNPLAVPTWSLGEAVAEEWRAQQGTIDPRTMPMTRLANTAIDGVAKELEAVQADMARYATSDLVVYRAGEPDRLVAAQAAAWDPILSYAREALGARFVLSEGVTFVAQSEEAVARVRAAIEAETSPFAMAALHVMTTLTGSALLALMHAAGRIDAETAWRAAHVDEFHQESQWGADHEAGLRRTAREAEFQTASTFLTLARP